MTGVKARRRTKAGDGFPLDVTGNFLSQGAIVAMPEPAGEPPLAAGEVPALTLGYVKRLGKSYADVVVLRRGDDGEPARTTIRLREPARRLVVIDPDSLNSQVKEFEALKLAAATDRDYS